MFGSVFSRSGCALLLAALIICSFLFAACGTGIESPQHESGAHEAAENGAADTEAAASDLPTDAPEPTDIQVETTEPTEPPRETDGPTESSEPGPASDPSQDVRKYWRSFLNSMEWMGEIYPSGSADDNINVQYIIRDFDGDEIPELVMLTGIENEYEVLDYSLSVWAFRTETKAGVCIHYTDDLPRFSEQKLSYSEKCNAFVEIDESAGGWAYYYYTIRDGAVAGLFSLQEDWEGEDAGVMISYEDGQTYEIEYEQYEEFKNELTPAESL